MNYFKELNKVLRKTEISQSNQKTISLEKAISQVVHLILNLNRKQNKVIIIGNGGSASIASHLATDFLKNAKIPALTFNDPSLITCLSNDLGYAYVFQRPLELLAKKNDLVIAISSSGESTNILNAARAARKKGCFLITLSGFKRKNPLRELGEINFYVPSFSYGYVEIAHLTICHYIIDKIIDMR